MYFRACLQGDRTGQMSKNLSTWLFAFRPHRLGIQRNEGGFVRYPHFLVRVVYSVLELAGCYVHLHIGKKKKP